MNKPKAVLVTGPESSGSKLIAKTLAHVMEIKEFGSWNGTRTVSNTGAKIHHQSLPSKLGVNKEWLDIDEWYTEHKNDWKTYIVLTTRDKNLSILSKIKRFQKSFQDSEYEMGKAVNIMSNVINSNYRYYIFSYESFILLQKEYIQLLYKYIGINSEFCPSIKDANKPYIKKKFNVNFASSWEHFKKTSKKVGAKMMSIK